MTLPAFPALDGIGWPVTVSPEYSTDVFTSQSGKELRTSNWAAPRFHFVLVLNFARNVTGFTQFLTLWNFYTSQQGSMLPFTYTSPADNTVYNCRFEDDNMSFEEFISAVWKVGSIKIVSIL